MRAAYAFAALVVLASASPAQEEHLLRLKFDPVKIWMYKTATDMEGTLSGMMGDDTKQDMTMSQSMTLKHKLAGVKEGVATVHTSFSDFDFELTMGGMDIGDMMGDSTDQFKDMLITSHIDDRGQTLDVKVSGLPKELSQMTMAGVNGFNMMSMLPTFPEEPIKIGHKWTSKIKNPMTFGMGETAARMKLPDISIAAELVGVETMNGRPTFKLRLETTMPFDVDMSEMTEAQGQGSMKMNGTGTYKATVWLDRESCFLVKTEFVSDSHVNMDMSNPMMGDMTMTMDMSGKGTVNLVEEK